MKISKLFHCLYAILMFLPLINVFAYTLRYGFNYGHEIPSVSENVQKTVEFNQQIAIGDLQTFNGNGVSCSVASDKWYLYGTSTNTLDVSFVHDRNYLVTNHVYIFQNTLEGMSSSLDTGYTCYFQVDSTLFIGGRYNRFTAVNNNPLRVYFKTQTGLSFDTYFNCTLFDLTDIFGVGNEPSTEQFISWFPDPYYPYTLSEYIVIPDYSSVSVSDDVTNHFWLPSFGQVGYTINDVIGYLLLNVFGLVVSEGIGYIVCGLFTYWLIISIAWLVFDLLMYVPMLIHRWLDKASLS